MATQEFYIRKASETEADGPFNHEQLLSLAETGQVNPATLYYDAGKEEWLPIGGNAELSAAIFPEKVVLKLKPKLKLKPSTDEAAASTAPLSVQEMLAASQGKTEETQHVRDPEIARSRAAFIGLYATIALLLISAGGLVLPSIEIFSNFEPAKLIQHPLVLLGLLNLALAVLLLLQMTSVYRVVRFSATLGIGLVGFLLWTQGQTVPFTAFAVGSAGLYFCTVFTGYLGVGLAAVLGFAGMLAYAFFALTT